eukprot:CAMPEP_0178968120 /NCGR_PEP_ID=MMETSP0789-20121207/18022_1 /TAXON_ID=3005 /ORGANISM="Rhizosolenia setigera, Strain CCMP 1694" /LENGTH=847 /DNA_ID=CAMNT_0020653903 /DNA_START=134 /DNA_END=2677 /DNA_ORIENTATION=-
MRCLVDLRSVLSVFLLGIISPNLNDAFTQKFIASSSAFIQKSNGHKREHENQIAMVASDVKVREFDDTKLRWPGKDDNDGNLRYSNRPIVLVGASGEGNELPRLASSLVRSISSLSDSTCDTGVIYGLEENSKTVLTVEDISSLVIGTEDTKPALNGKNVIVLDYADSLFSDRDLINAQNELARFLYDDLNCLCIYINVHPDAGSLSSTSKAIRSEFEESTFIEYSDYELALREEGNPKTDPLEWKNAEWELNRIVARSYLPRPVPGEDGTYTLNSGASNSCNDAKFILGGKNTFFLSLSFPEIELVHPYVSDLCLENDAMEFRADLLSCKDDRHAILHSQFKLRSMCRPYATRAPALPFGTTVIDDALPVVFTVRTAGQAGTYPDKTPEDIVSMFKLLRLGIRGASEVMDIESAWDKTLTNNLLQELEEKYSCLILGSHHVVPEEVSLEEAVKLFHQCEFNGRAHGTKVVLSIQDSEKDHMALDASKISSQLAKQENRPVTPGISLILGEVGVYSRILNAAITPVTHPSLPFRAAPGQLSSKEIMDWRAEDGTCKSRSYAILGHNIAYSVSPQMQGAAFKATGLPHTYGRADVKSVEDFVAGDLWNSADFGGCSVTIPHKQSIIPYVDVMSDAAQRIGSVNTITAQYGGEGDKKRVIYGDNTDWRGIYNPLKRRFNGDAKGFALILGAGGTARAAAYAAQQLGLSRIYYNRTPEKAQDLVDSFGGLVVTSLDSNGEGSLGNVLTEESVLQVIISTLPASVEFELPAWILSDSQCTPIIFDVNYKPYWTKLLHQANRNNCDVVRGSEMLWEQGVGQFEIWTGRTAPYKVMKEVVLENCLPQSANDES